MNPDLFRAIDRFVGVPGCAVASGFGLLSPAKAPPKEPRRALFIQLSEMGSAVLAQPAVSCFKKAHPSCELFWLTLAHNREIADALGLVPPQNVVTIDAWGFSAFLSSGAKAVARLRALEIDTVFDFELFARFSALLSFCTGAARRVGFSVFHQEGLYRGRLLTHPVFYNCHQHMSKNFLAQVLSLSKTGQTPLLKEAIADPLPIPPLSPDPEILARVKERLYDLCPQRAARHIIVLNPGAGNLLPIRAWPLEHFVRLGNMILENLDAMIVITGPPESRNLGFELSEGLPRDRRADLTGRTGFSEFLALLSMSQAIITADSGAAHFAGATDTPTVALFGPETPVLYAPLGKKTVCLSAGLSCSPCLSAFNHRKTPCTKADCMRAITPESVFAALKRLLEG